jgi:hypothetical protein
MPIELTCASCGKSYSLRDDLQGKSVRCRDCGTVATAGGGPAPAAKAGAPLAAGDPAFARDKFLLRQKAMALTAEKYYVWDEQGKTILFIQRPTHMLQTLGAILAGFLAGAVLSGVLGFLASLILKGSPAAAVVGGIGFFAGLIPTIFALAPKRHVEFYRDDTLREPLLRVLQDQKFAGLRATYTVEDLRENKVLARLEKHYLYDILRKRWYIYDAQGARVLAMALEDSIILSLLRRFLGPLFGFLRTNFLIVRGESDDVIGEFNRKFTLLDRYVLDMTADRKAALDRRVAVALGVMLDTGERR